MLRVSGTVDADLGTTGYEVLIFNSKNNLVFHKTNSFETDATFDIPIDISKSVWEKNEAYTLKLVYGVPSEATIFSLKIPDNDQGELKIRSLELCNEPKSTNDFNFDGINLPNWYKNPLCWYGNNLLTENEITNLLDFFKKI